MTQRYPHRVFGRGEEPDPRFSLANERTFLAWIRTSLALVAGGVALQALVVDMHSGLRAVAAGIFILLGLVAAVHAWLGWARTEGALRAGKALPGAAVGAIIAAGLGIAVVLVVLGLIVPW
ncbi:YidH family protein [Microbacterium sp. YY-01]|uniref:YidH family protein n=1 Tax=Microbacterium sp. YY-01 TaxID=3421634 RepID=UPI003D163F44